ncbi:MAG: MarR family transcriptional regulator [Actinobacteria bacterium]|nr:MarR family transcriptional regulator [Actinomycetota bacterium]
MVPARAYDDTRLTDGLVVMLGLLATYASRDGWVVCQGDLARRRGVSRQAISKALTALEAHGYVERSERRDPTGAQLANGYRVLYDAELDPDFDRCQVAPPATGGLPPPQPNAVAPKGIDQKAQTTSVLRSDGQVAPRQTAATLVKHWWEAQPVAPKVSFIGVVKVVEGLLTEGKGDADTIRAALDTAPCPTRNALLVALHTGRARPDRTIAEAQAWLSSRRGR